MAYVHLIHRDHGGMMISSCKNITLSMAIVLATAVLAAPAFATVLASSDFSSGDEGWMNCNFFEPFGIPVAANYSSSGGNPGGHVWVNDEYDWNAFLAPAEFLGNQSAAYGGTLTLDMYDTEVDSSYATAVVMLSDGTSAIYSPPVAVESPLGPPFRSYVVPLTASAGWNYQPDGGGLPVSEATLQSVLGNLQIMTINADWHGGADEVHLDNVILNGPVPVTLASSDFSSGDEGWMNCNFFEPFGIPVAANYSSSGGNPGGHVWVNDEYDWNAFLAPAEFLGNQSAAYGGTLTLDMYDTEVDSSYATAVVMLSDGTSAIYSPPVAVESLLGPPFRSYVVPLTASAGWNYQRDGGGLPVSEATLQSVLGNLQIMTINADWHGGADEVHLDNVVLSGPASAVPGGATPNASSLRLLPPSPNPFRAHTTLGFELPAPGRVRLELFDLQGRHVRTLLDASVSAGRHEVPLVSRGLRSGMYFYRVTAGGDVGTGRLIAIP